MSEPLDLKLLGRLLTEAGLVDKNFAAMSADEVRGVAGCMDLATKKLLHPLRPVGKTARFSMVDRQVPHRGA